MRLVPPVLRVRTYREIWLGSLASNGGTWLQIVAAGFLIWELTGSALAVGFLAVTARGPSVVLAPLAGQLADRFDRRRLAVVAFTAQSVAASALALTAALGALSVPVIYVLSTILWSGFALGLPSMLALIPLLVPREHFSQAVTVNAAGINVARLIGPAIGGVVLALAGPAWCFGVNAASYWVLIAALIRAGAPPAPAPKQRATVRDGLRYAMADVALRRLLLGMAVFTTFAAVIQELAPVINGRLDGGAVELGALLSAMGGGGVVGAVIYERLRGIGVGASTLLPTASAVFALGLFLIAVSPWVWLTLPVMGFCGAFWIWLFSGTNTSIQLRSSRDYVGRMLGFYQLAVVGGIGLGSLVAGAVAARIGIAQTLAIWAAILLAWGLWSFVNRVPEIDEPSAENTIPAGPGAAT
ncbi:MAG: MFS transporter [Thermoleophilia bacterium]|nr:MFS transporter [Thermoleophilia bacterium]MDH3724290.1 MFS transporter [Thermoleophilia bacterium]